MRLHLADSASKYAPVPDVTMVTLSFLNHVIIDGRVSKSRVCYKMFISFSTVIQALVAKEGRWASKMGLSEQATANQPHASIS